MPKVTKAKKANPLLDSEVKTKATDVENEVDNTENETSPAPVVKEKPVEPFKEAVSEKNIAKSMSSDIENTRKALAKEEQVTFMIPLADGEKVGAVHDCWINGFKVSVPKGRMAVLPKSIVHLLSESYNVVAESGAEFRLDLDDDKYKHLN